MDRDKATQMESIFAELGREQLPHHARVRGVEGVWVETLGNLLALSNGSGQMGALRFVPGRTY